MHSNLEHPLKTTTLAVLLAFCVVLAASTLHAQIRFLVGEGAIESNVDDDTTPAEPDDIVVAGWSPPSQAECLTLVGPSPAWTTSYPPFEIPRARGPPVIS